MSNRHASKQHGLVGNKRPKSKLRKRRNKAKARARRLERMQIKEAKVIEMPKPKVEKAKEVKEEVKKAA